MSLRGSGLASLTSRTGACTTQNFLAVQSLTSDDEMVKIPPFAASVDPCHGLGARGEVCRYHRLPRHTVGSRPKLIPPSGRLHYHGRLLHRRAFSQTAGGCTHTIAYKVRGWSTGLNPQILARRHSCPLPVARLPHLHHNAPEYHLCFLLFGFALQLTQPSPSLARALGMLHCSTCHITVGT